MTLREWLDIYMDLDAYVAKGGRLLDLELYNPEDWPPDAQKYILERMGPERLARMDRFLARLAVGMDPDQMVGHGLTEDEIRAIWRETVGPSTEALH
jgi:hypothetical protein